MNSNGGVVVQWVHVRLAISSHCRRVGSTPALSCLLFRQFRVLWFSSTSKELIGELTVEKIVTFMQMRTLCVIYFIGHIIMFHRFPRDSFAKTLKS